MQPCRPSGKFACYSTANQACNTDPAARHRCFHPAVARPMLANALADAWRTLHSAHCRLAGHVIPHLTSWHPAKQLAACATPPLRHCSCRRTHSAGLLTGIRRPARWQSSNRPYILLSWSTATAVCPTLTYSIATGPHRSWPHCGRQVIGMQSLRASLAASRRGRKQQRW